MENVYPKYTGNEGEKQLPGGDSERPTIRTVLLEQLPATLKDYGHMVAWQFEFDAEAKDPAKQWRKVPKVAAGDCRRNASSTDPATWVSYRQAVAAYCTQTQGTVGMGYVFAKPDRRYPRIKPTHVDELVFVDLDKCRDPVTGEVAGWAQDIIRRFNTYTEESPSRTGVHLYLRGGVAKSYKVGDIEVYAAGRFTTLTGMHLEGTPDDIQPAQEALDWLVARLAKDTKETLNGRYADTRDLAKQQVAPPVRLNDADLLTRIRRSKQGEKFMRLYDEGDYSEYPSQSEAVGSLVCMLAFWTRKDAERIDRLFRASALFAGKWLHKWDDPRGDVTLGVCEIASAFALVGDEVYTEPNDQNAKPAAPSTPEERFRVLTREEQNALQPPEYLIDLLLQHGAVTDLYGAYATFKSTILVDLGCHLASGLPDYHKLPIRRHGNVLYLAGEDAIGIVQRVTAWEQTYNDGEPLEEFYLVPTVPHLVRPEDVDRLYAVLQERGQHYVLLIMETLIKAMEGGDENVAADVTLAFSQARRLLDFADCILVAAHTGWAEADRPRGSSAMGGDLETLLRVKREDGSPDATILVRKQKNGRDGQSFTLTMQEVELSPATADRLAVSSLVATGDASSLLDAPKLRGVAPARPGKRGRRSIYTAHDAWACLVEGASYGDWQSATEGVTRMSPSTFQKHMKYLLKNNCVAKRGDGYCKVPGTFVDTITGEEYQYGDID